MSSELHGRAKELFLAASERPRELRQSFLEEHCAGDEELRREVESLLDYLDDQIDRGAAAAGTERRKIANYRLVRMVGEGGMGVVWEAEQERPLQRRVALKILKAGLESREILVRFDAERQALALMDHPNIATVFDAGTSDEGRPYFAMEYVEGTPITEYCDANRLTVHQRLALLVQICRGVEHAHQRGVIHRDLKPSNLLVSVVDGTPVPKIIDFGVAKATGPSFTEQPLVTEPGRWIGTPEYMSPEQVESGATAIDGRTDVYSLGVILYELLVGLRPYGSGDGRVGVDELRRRVLEEEPIRPSAGVGALGEALEQVARDRGVDGPRLAKLLRGDLDWITLSALERDRSRRYGSPGELGADVERYLEGEPSVAGPPSLIRRVGGRLRRQRARIVGAALLLLAIAAGVGGTALWLQRSTAQREVSRPSVVPLPRSVAVLPFDNLSEEEADEYFSDGLSEELINALAQIGGLQVAARTSSFAFKGRKEDVRRIGEELGVGVLLEGSVRRSGDRLRISAQLIEAASGFHLWSAVFDRGAGEVFAIQDEIARAVADALEVKLLTHGDSGARAERTIAAYDLYLRGRQALRGRSPEALSGAIRLFSAAIDLDPTYAAAHSGLAESHILLARRGDLPMEDAERRAGAALKQALELDGELAEAHATLGLLRSTIGAAEGAETSLRRAIELNGNLASAHLLLGRLLASQNRGDEADAAYDQAVKLDPLNREAHHAVARSWMDRGRYEEALGLFEQWLRIEPDSPETFRVMAIYARTYGELDRAVEWARRAVELDPLSPLNLHELVMAYSQLGEVALAGEWMERAYALAPNNHWTQALRAFTFVERGDFDGLEAFTSRLLELEPQAATGPLPQVTRVRLALAGLSKVYRGDYSSAADLYERALGEPFVGVLEPGIDADALAFLAYAYTRLGREGKAGAAIDRCLELISSRQDWIWAHLVIPETIAAVRVLQGRDEDAVEILSQAFADGWTQHTVLLRGPHFEALRQRPDFRRLMARVSARLEELRERVPPAAQQSANDVDSLSGG